MICCSLFLSSPVLELWGLCRPSSVSIQNSDWSLLEALSFLIEFHWGQAPETKQLLPGLSTISTMSGDPKYTDEPIVDSGARYRISEPSKDDIEG